MISMDRFHSVLALILTLAQESDRRSIVHVKEVKNRKLILDPNGTDRLPLSPDFGGPPTLTRNFSPRISQKQLNIYSIYKQ